MDTLGRVFASIPMPVVRLLRWCGAVLAALTVVTSVNPQWFERITGMSPDGGSGGLEWELVASFGAGTLCCFALAAASSLARRAGNAS